MGLDNVPIGFAVYDVSMSPVPLAPFIENFKLDCIFHCISYIL